MIDWIIFYDDGSSFTNEDGLPESAPKDGVQIIGTRDIGVGVRWRQNTDHYCWQDGTWIGHSKEVLHHYKRRCLERNIEPLTLNGYELPDNEYYKIVNQATNDPRLVKTAVHPLEDAPE